MGDKKKNIRDHLHYLTASHKNYINTLYLNETIGQYRSFKDNLKSNILSLDKNFAINDPKKVNISRELYDVFKDYSKNIYNILGNNIINHQFEENDYRENISDLLQQETINIYDKIQNYLKTKKISITDETKKGIYDLITYRFSTNEHGLYNKHMEISLDEKEKNIFNKESFEIEDIDGYKEYGNFSEFLKNYYSDRDNSFKTELFEQIEHTDIDVDDIQQIQNIIIEHIEKNIIVKSEKLYKEIYNKRLGLHEEFGKTETLIKEKKESVLNSINNVINITKNNIIYKN